MDSQAIGYLRQYAAAYKRGFKFPVQDTMVDTVRAVALVKVPAVDGKRTFTPEQVAEYVAFINRLNIIPLTPAQITTLAAPMVVPASV